MSKNYEIKLAVKTVSPVAIIETSEDEGGGNIVTKIKRMAFLADSDEGKKVEYLPYLPANGVRGLLRRLATKKLVEAVKANEKITEIKDTDIHAMLSGSGATKAPLRYADLAELREKNPLLSLFGTGLVLGGKLKVADLIPEDKTQSRSLIRRITFARVDDILSDTKFSNIFTREQASAWEKTVEENSGARKKEREDKKALEEAGGKADGDKKVKKESIQHYAQKEYLVPNASLNGGFYLEGATELELGLFLHALEEFMLLGRLGSSQNIGFGIVDIHMQDKNREMNIDRVANNDYIFNAKTEMNLSGDYKRAYDAYAKFLKEANRENLEILSKY